MVLKNWVLLVLLCAAVNTAPAQPSPQSPQTPQPQEQQPQAQQARGQPQQGPSTADPRAEIAARIPGARVDELRATVVPGLWELTRGAEIVYVTADGKYAFTGDLYDLASNHNLTEQHRRELRVKAMSAFPESDMVVFGPKELKYTVTVFTDVDCPYCRKLHSQIGEYNRLGIRVRYLLYPRTGPNSVSWTKAEQVWCSTDRNAALTRAKLGEALQTKPCANNPVARSYALGQDFALEGTPAIVTADGEMLPGYVPPDVLAKHLKDGK
jgi:thiol:disulfide interchange protein DsbC